MTILIQECEMVINGSPPPYKIPQIKSGGTSITLPNIPNEISIKYEADQSSIPIPPNTPIVISMGSKVDEMIWKGRLYQIGQTLSQITTSFVVPLSTLKHKVVYITFTDRAQYSGYWLLATAEFKEKGGNVNSYDQSLTFIRGSVYVIMEAPA